jgi:hypothetical protein
LNGRVWPCGQGPVGRGAACWPGIMPCCVPGSAHIAWCMVGTEGVNWAKGWGNCKCKNGPRHWVGARWTPGRRDMDGRRGSPRQLGRPVPARGTQCLCRVQGAAAGERARTLQTTCVNATGKGDCAQHTPSILTMMHWLQGIEPSTSQFIVAPCWILVPESNCCVFAASKMRSFGRCARIGVSDLNALGRGCCRHSRNPPVEFGRGRNMSRGRRTPWDGDTVTRMWALSRRARAHASR